MRPVRYSIEVRAERNVSDRIPEFCWEWCRPLPFIDDASDWYFDVYFSVWEKELKKRFKTDER